MDERIGGYSNCPKCGQVHHHDEGCARKGEERMSDALKGLRLTPAARYKSPLERKLEEQVEHLTRERDAAQGCWADQAVVNDHLHAENERLRGLLREGVELFSHCQIDVYTITQAQWLKQANAVVKGGEK